MSKPIAWTTDELNTDNWGDTDWQITVTKEKWSDKQIPLYTHPHPDNLGFELSIIDQQKLEIEAMRKDYMVLAGKYQDALLELKFGKAQEK